MGQAATSHSWKIDSSLLLFLASPSTASTEPDSAQAASPNEGLGPLDRKEVPRLKLGAEGLLVKEQNCCKSSTGFLLSHGAVSHGRLRVHLSKQDLAVAEFGGLAWVEMMVLPASWLLLVTSLCPQVTQTWSSVAQLCHS